MSLPVIAILMPGDMGHGVGRALREHGHRVVTCLAGRSARTRGLAEQAGLEDCGDLETLVAEADLILSILPPGRALQQAKSVAQAIAATGQKPVYADCNAISPQRAEEIGAVIEGAGAPYIDAGIIGLAPGKPGKTRFYVSGKDLAPMTALDGKGFEVIALDDRNGTASGLKMCYAALTKGKWSLYAALLLTAHRLGVSEALYAEFEDSQANDLQAMRGRIPRLPADSERWAEEMDEIAATFADAGVPSGFHEGAGDIYRIIARTPLANETRETIDADRTMEETLRVIADVLPNTGKAS